jgi:hypothetical protein
MAKQRPAQKKDRPRFKGAYLKALGDGKTFDNGGKAHVAVGGLLERERERVRAQGLSQPRIDSCGNSEERTFALRSMSVKEASCTRLLM